MAFEEYPVIGIIEILDILRFLFEFNPNLLFNYDQFFYELIFPLHKQKHLHFFHQKLVSFILFYINYYPVSVANLIVNLVKISPKDSKMIDGVTVAA
ncbi:hypothetical protein MXB_76 [Myxobolus squamalis]|nr:hypothetical protein MXB_76 [Myxobolus squamalis]